MEDPASDGKLILSTDLGSTTPGASQPAPPPTPPLSLAETTEETARLRHSLEDHQSKIYSLTVKLEDAQDEVRHLREERRDASDEYTRAILEDREEEIEKCRRREERLIKTLKNKELFIKDLESSMDEGRERENKLRRKLMETERRAEASEERSRDIANSISQHKDITAEGNTTVQELGNTGLGRNRFEFRRRKGDSITPVRAIYRVVAKGASFEKAAAL